MKKSGFYAVTSALIILVFHSLASARDVGLTLEYYHTSDRSVIDRVYMTELRSEEYKQKLYNDLMIADESSRRSLNELLGVYEWYYIDRFRKALSRESQVFSEEFIMPEDMVSAQTVMVSDKELEVQFNIRTVKNRHIPVGMNIVYDFRELFSDIPRPYPVDNYILLNALNKVNEGSEVLEVLMMKLTHYETEDPVQEEILKDAGNVSGSP